MTTEYVFTYKVTVKAKKTDVTGKFDEGELETEVRQLIEDQDGESVYISSESDEEIAFDTSWTVEFSG